MLLVAGLIVLVNSLSVHNVVQAQTSAVDAAPTPHLPNVNYQNQTVYIGVWLINVYSFDYRTGSYTFDMYVYYFWTDPHIATIDWYLMNGYPTYPGAKLLVESNYNGTVHWEVYRVRANLNTPIEAKNYPFDVIGLPISIELLPFAYNASLVWLPQDTGISGDFKNVGWNNPTFTLSTSNNTYPLDVTSSRVDMTIRQSRSTYFAFADTILPPLIFCLVSAVSYLFKMHENNAFSLRVGIDTSMLITAVLYNINQQNSIPPISQLTLYTAFIDSVFAFLAINLTVTVLGYVNYTKNQNKPAVDQLNKWGFLFSLAVPIVTFLILFLII